MLTTYTSNRDIFVQSKFSEITGSVSTTSLTFVDLISSNISVQIDQASLAVFFTATFTTTDSASNAGGVFQLLLDGVTKRKCAAGFGSANAGPGLHAKFTYVIPNVSIGARVIKIQWLSNAGGTIQIRPNTTINESASLNVIELIG